MAHAASECGVAHDARAWAHEHLPPDEPSVLLHGDLLGQNLLVSLDDDVPIGVIDWHSAMIGDPAYDLAIVTRGKRRPFQSDSGMNKLLEAYQERAGTVLSPVDVSLYEMTLQAHFCAARAQSHGTESAHAENERRTFANLLRRVTATRSCGRWATPTLRR